MQKISFISCTEMKFVQFWLLSVVIYGIVTIVTDRTIQLNTRLKTLTHARVNMIKN